MADKIFSIYDEKYMSEDDKRILADVKRRAMAGETDWNSAHNLFEQTRAKYGYSGGDDGSQYIRLDSGTPDSFGRVETPKYESPYQDNINELKNSILNPKEFTYNHETDPAYLELEKAYTKGAKRAMDDTLGKVSSRTGGIASSYAGQVAQETYNDYMDDLSDKVTALRESAYQKHLNERETDRANLNTLLAIDSDNYNKFVNEQNFKRADESFNYGIYRDEQTDKKNAAATALNEAQIRAQYGDFSGLEALGFDMSSYQKDIADSKRNSDFNNELSFALTKAQYGDFSGLHALGIDTTAYEQQLAAQRESSAQVTNSSDTDTIGDTSDYFNISTAQNLAKNGVFTSKVIDSLMYHGYKPEEMSGLWGNDIDWYNYLTPNAQSALSNIQRSQQRNGVKGLTQAQINNLEGYVVNGQITPNELDVILYMLGV